MDLYTRISDYITQQMLITPGMRVLVAVSGGPDSITLLDSLVQFGCKVIVAHYDHQIRPESAQDAAYVADLAKQYDCECVIERAVNGQLNQSGMSLEEAARIYRYQFLWRTAVKCKVDVVAVGHTADDQVETILMHLLRGAGPTGLRGMLPVTLLNQWAAPEDTEKHKPISLFRPLLSICRADTVRHCKDLGIEPRWDNSNLDTTFFRNRLRHELLPLMETYNSGIRTHLLQLSHLMKVQEAWVSEEVFQRISLVCRRAGSFSFAISRPRFLELPAALQGTFIYSLLGRLLPDERNLSFAVIERIVKGIRDGEPRRMPLLSGLELIQAAEEVVICHVSAELVFPQFPLLETDAKEDFLNNSLNEFNLGFGWKLEIKAFPDFNPDTFKKIIPALNRCCAAFDMDELDGLLKLRSKNPGDRIVYHNTGLSKKVSDVLMEAKIPSIIRNRWPLLTDQKSVLWVPGIRRGINASISRSTKNAIVIRLSHPLETLRLDKSADPISVNNEILRSCMAKPLLGALYMQGSVLAAAFTLGVRADRLLQGIHEWQNRTGINLLEPDGEGSAYSCLPITAGGMQILGEYQKIVC